MKNMMQSSTLQEGESEAAVDMPVVRDLRDFDLQSGNLLERLTFNYRVWLIALCVIATLVLAWQGTRLVVNAGFDKMLPQGHPYIQNYFEFRNDLRGLGNTVRIVVSRSEGDILDAGYIETLKQINDAVFLTPGVDRAWMKSLWTPAVRWNEVTEEGFSGGPVMPGGFDGSAAALAQLRLNIARGGLVGSLVATDFNSSMILVPLLDKDPQTGERLDYAKFSRALEEQVRQKFEKEGVGIHIIGFAQIVGELIDGLRQVMLFFLGAAVVAAALIFAYTRCLRSTGLLLLCSGVAVVWQLGLVSALGFELDPYSVLVPFLVFAIGVSHGAQKMNGIMLDIARGTHRLVAARYTFRRLFLAGLTALLADAVGFAVLMIIDIPIIKDLALTASIGVAVLIFTNLLLLPVLLSYTGVSPGAAARSLRDETEEGANHGAGAVWALLDRFTTRRWATISLVATAVLAAAGVWLAKDLQIGDLDSGAPELRPESRYNQDNAFITKHYALSSDLFAVIIKTPVDGCLTYQTLVEADRLAWELQQLPGVQATITLADAVRRMTAGTFEGNPKFLAISPNQDILNNAAQQALVNNPELFNTECSVLPVIAYLRDHKAATLDSVVAVAEKFAATHSRENLQFKLAAGSAGIEAATNIVVRESNRVMMAYVFGAVALLCLLAFRSWRATIVAMVPLALTSLLAEALMVAMGIGVKVATLPVVALGVGIGVDYALYLLSTQLAQQRQGMPLEQAFRRAVQFTGKMVVLVGCTLSVAVVTWAFSPIKFQADMGVLLTFMFFLNMVGAMVLVPALSHFLLPTSAVRRDAPTAPTTGTGAVALRVSQS